MRRYIDFLRFIIFMDALFAIFTLVVTSQVVFAASASAASIDLGPLVEPVVTPVLGAIGLLVSGYLVRLLHKAAAWLDGDTEAKLRAAIQTAVSSGIALATTQVSELVKGGANVDVKSETIARASNYLIERVPESLVRFGLTGSALETFVAAKMSELPPAFIVDPSGAVPQPRL